LMLRPAHGRSPHLPIPILKRKKVCSNPATPFRLLYIDIVEVNYQDNTPRFWGTTIITILNYRLNMKLK
jgi:hypothetical protein